jgi:hypothetical protein
VRLAPMRDRMRHDPPGLGIAHRDTMLAQMRREIVREHAEEMSHRNASIAASTSASRVSKAVTRRYASGPKIGQS